MKFAIITITGKVIKVLSINIIINSFIFTGIFEPSKTPPTSDIYTSWVTDTAATINFVISLVIVVEATTEGRSISANPTTNVWEAASASGTCNKWSIGTNGKPNILNTGVYVAIIRAIVAMHITTGRTPIHISKTFLPPSAKNSFTLEFFLAFIIACSYPHDKELYPLGIDSSIFSVLPL